LVGSSGGFDPPALLQNSWCLLANEQQANSFTCRTITAKNGGAGGW
jgi:hypothetical protein